MKLTPAVKGKITKQVKHIKDRQQKVIAVRNSFIYGNAGVGTMPREQAKHLTKKYLCGVA